MLDIWDVEYLKEVTMHFYKRDIIIRHGRVKQGQNTPKVHAWGILGREDQMRSISKIDQVHMPELAWQTGIF